MCSPEDVFPFVCHLTTCLEILLKRSADLNGAVCNEEQWTVLDGALNHCLGYVQESLAHLATHPASSIPAGLEPEGWLETLKPKANDAVRLSFLPNPESPHRGPLSPSSIFLASATPSPSTRGPPAASPPPRAATPSFETVDRATKRLIRQIQDPRERPKGVAATPKGTGGRPYVARTDDGPEPLQESPLFQLSALLQGLDIPQCWCWNGVDQSWGAWRAAEATGKGTATLPESPVFLVTSLLQGIDMPQCWHWPQHLRKWGTHR